MKSEHAFAHSPFPANMRPFLTRMQELLEEEQTSNITNMDEEKYFAFRACLLVINQMVFGQMSVVHLSDEWRELFAEMDERGAF
jgi:hypothetical protein